MAKKAAKVKLSLTGVNKLGSANGLDALSDRLKGSNREQYVILRVTPVEDVRRRGAADVGTTILISGVEPLVDQHDVNAAASLMEEAARLRLKGQGIQETLDLDSRAEQGETAFDKL